jgi:hypothetical protein
LDEGDGGSGGGGGGFGGGTGGIVGVQFGQDGGNGTGSAKQICEKSAKVSNPRHRETRIHLSVGPSGRAGALGMRYADFTTARNVTRERRVRLQTYLLITDCGPSALAPSAAVRCSTGVETGDKLSRRKRGT